MSTISMYSVLTFNGESRYHISLYFLNGQKYLYIFIGYIYLDSYLQQYLYID